MQIRDLAGLRTRIGFYDVKDELKAHVYGRSLAAFDAGDAARDAIRDPRALEARQKAMRARFIEAIGGLPPSDAPLAAEVRGAIQEDGLTIERVVFQSRPRVYVTANLYLPHGLRAPSGAVLFLCGHHREAKVAEEYQVACRILARAGLVVLAQDPPGQGERLDYWDPALGASTVEWGVVEHDHVGWQCLPLGDGLARYFVHDAMRGLDYLASRPEVDPGRIGVTGNSGGGTQTSMLMACDPRLAAAAPATFIMSRRSYLGTGQAQDAEQHWRGMSKAGFDHEDLLLLMAPRPTLVLAVTSDFFPIEGTRSTVARARRGFELLGAGDRLELFEDDSEHHYTTRLAQRAAGFFALHLNVTSTPPRAVSLRAVDPARLQCTVTGQVRGELTDAEGIHDENRRRLDSLGHLRAARADAEARDDALTWLRGRVFAHRNPCTPAVRRLFEALGGREIGLRYEACLWWSQEGVHGGGVLLRPCEHERDRLPLSIGIWQHGTAEIPRHLEWIAGRCASGRAVLVPDLSGMGMLEPNPVNEFPNFARFGTLSRFACDLLWLDDSIPALRAWELLRAIDIVESDFADLDAGSIDVHGVGRYAMYAELAGFLDRRIGTIDVVDGLESFASLAGARLYDTEDASAVILPDMLRHFDLPDLRRWRTT